MIHGEARGDYDAEGFAKTEAGLLESGSWNRALGIGFLEMRSKAVLIVRVSYGSDSGWIAIDFSALLIRPLSIFGH